VRIHETSVLTDVELTLRALSGETRQWQVFFPPQVIPEVREPRPPDERIESIDLPDARNRTLTIRLKEPSAEPLKGVFQVRQVRPRAPFAVGPFTVPGVLRTRGVISVSAPPDLRLRFRPRGDVVQRDLSEETRRENAVAEFTYGNLPAPADPGKAAPPLEIEVEEIKGAVGTRVEHGLILTDTGWRDKLVIHVTPFRTKVSQLDVDLPASFQYDTTVGPSPLELIDRVDILDGSSRSRIAQVKLVKDVSQPFTVTLQGVYALAANQQKTALELPRPLQTLDRGGQITAALPEGMELIIPDSGPDAPAKVQPSAGTAERSVIWSMDRLPTRVELAWRPYRPDLPVPAVAD